MSEAEKPWVIRDVPESVRQKVKVYAAQHNITIAEALEVLIDKALAEPQATVLSPSVMDTVSETAARSEQLLERMRMYEEEHESVMRQIAEVQKLLERQKPAGEKNGKVR